MVKTREVGLNSLFLENQPNQTGIKLEIRSFYITNWKTGQIDKPIGYLLNLLEIIIVLALHYCFCFLWSKAFD